MNPAQPGGHVGIEAGDEWNASGTAQPRRCDARNRDAQHQREGRDDPRDAELSRHFADGLQTPCNTLMPPCPIATRSVSVAAMKRLPEITPPHRTAPGRVRCGSLISSPMTDASSSPTSAKQITPKEFRTARGSWGMRKSAAVIVSPV